MSPTTRARAALRDERGFTLIELMVALVVGMIVLLVAFNMLDVSVQQTAQITERVDADQRGRHALETLTQELHSSCVAPAVGPIQASDGTHPGSDSSHLAFLSQFGSAPLLTPDLHVISVAGGQIIDTVYPANAGGAAGNWTFAASPTRINQLLTNVAAASVGSPPTIQPAFQYYAYGPNGQLLSAPLQPPFSAAVASSAVAVTIAFAAQPTSGSPDVKRTVNFDDSVVLRLTPVPTPATTQFPCA